jgi:rhodanese-related sulfurtransferase
MKKTVKEVIFIVLLATALALLVDALSPVGIPWVGQWDVSKGVIRADNHDLIAMLGFEIDDVEIAGKIYGQGSAVFLDARSRSAYEDGHIRGAISMPVNEFDDVIEPFSKQYAPEQTFIAYCSGRFCEDSHQLAERLYEHGYHNVLVMIDGYPGWLEKGLPVEEGVMKNVE